MGWRRGSGTVVSLVLAACLLLGLAATASAALTLRSSDIRPTGMIAKRFIFNGFGCTGANAQPTLTWTGAPRGTKAFALAVFDPDAPTTVGFVHWLLLRIPPTVTSTANATTAVNGLTDFGEPGYHGPCPPPGDKPHRYIFTLYALDTDFPFTSTTTYAVFRFTIRGHVLASARLIGRYGR
jgi:Raf kinase inhibitor-like YbhB/YbcL family protein